MVSSVTQGYAIDPQQLSLSRPPVSLSWSSKKTPEIKLSDMEQKQRDYLQYLGILINGGHPLIRNLHYECAGNIFGSSYDNTIRFVRSTLGSNYPQEPETRVVDLYIDTPEHTLMLTMNIYLRVRLFANQQYVALKLIANMKDPENAIHTIEEVPFKSETVYLTDVTELRSANAHKIAEYLSTVNSQLKDLTIVGIISKKKVHFTLTPWSYVQSEYADLTMSNEWMNLLVEQVKKYRTNTMSFASFLENFDIHNSEGIVRFLRTSNHTSMITDVSHQEEVHLELEASRDDKTLNSASRIIKQLGISESTFTFETTPKSAIFLN
jgi:hypothetical protein